MGKIHWMKDGTTTVTESDKWPPLKQMQEFVGGYIERATVLHNGKPASMIVNEEGALAKWPNAPLPINEEATKLYHATIVENMVRQGHRREIAETLCRVSMACIHGPAILLEGISDDDDEDEEA